MTMDINTIRILITLVSLAAFIAIVWWVYKPSRSLMLQEEGKRIVEEHE
jgi:cbb3-type cytochrome oxidase subunit 3